MTRLEEFLKFPEAIVCGAMANVCNGGNCDPELLARDVIRALRTAGYELRATWCPKCSHAFVSLPCDSNGRTCNGCGMWRP